MTEELKRWGYVGAKPSEFLVCTRRGQIDRARSGQGRRIFKWPWHSTAVVPTTLQRIEFTADQITRERVGVEVTGIAVYRIAEPLLAFRVLDFSDGVAAGERLATTLREMFLGAARRLIANLSLEDCLTRRKESIAGYLMEEIAPVVGGEGAPDDTTSKGWGVVIDTIEIQQVTIQSEQVFAHLQAPYRASIAAHAELADLERKRDVAEVSATVARRSSELERDRMLHSIAIGEEQRRVRAAAEVAALEAERGRIEALHRGATLEVEHERSLKLRRQEVEHELGRSQAEVALELRRREADMRDQEGALEAVQQRRLAEIEQLVARDRALHELVTVGLPKIAAALHHSYGTVNYTQVGGDGGSGPLAAVPQAFAQLLALAKSFGLNLP
jgi:flotillin